MNFAWVDAKRPRRLGVRLTLISVMVLTACAQARPSPPEDSLSVSAIYVLDESPSGASTSRVVELRSSDLEVIRDWPSGNSATFTVNTDGSRLVIASHEPDGSDWLEVIDLIEGNTLTRVPIKGRALWIGPPLGNPRLAVVGTKVIVYSYDVVAPDHADYSIVAYDLETPAAPPLRSEVGSCGIDAWLLPTGADSLAVVCPASSEVIALTVGASDVVVQGRVALPRQSAPGAPDGLDQVVGADIMPSAKRVIAVTGLGRLFVVDMDAREVVSEHEVLEEGAYVALHSVSVAPDGGHLLLGTGDLGDAFSRVTAHRLLSIETAGWSVSQQAALESFLVLDALPGGSALTLGQSQVVMPDGTAVSTTRAVEEPTLSAVVVS